MLALSDEYSEVQKIFKVGQGSQIQNLSSISNVNYGNAGPLLNQPVVMNLITIVIDDLSDLV